MRTFTIVSKVIVDCKDCMHVTRWQRLVDLSSAAVNGQALALTQLALGSASKTTVRHRVKAVDRLLGNPSFAAEHLDLYRTLAIRWLSGADTLLVVVDWSSLSADMKWHWLRASVVVEGRSITLYEEVHPRCHLGAYAVHRRFLERLSCVLPTRAAAPIILTDAGFRGTWFALVKAQGWHWIGRVRNREYVSRVEPGQQGAAHKKSPRWFPAKTLYTDAGATSEDLGVFDSPRHRPNRCRLVRVKRLPTGRKHRYPSGKEQRHTQAKKSAAAAREPWLLSCAPGLAHLSAEAVVSLYAQRMKIEQSFRDTKNERLGLGLTRSLSHGQRRLEALLLIGHIASIAKRLIGEAAKAMQLQLQLISRKQAKHHHRAELSVLTIATRVIANPSLMRKIGNPLAYLQRLREQACAAGNPSPMHS
jgi:Transposase DDE domain